MLTRPLSASDCLDLGYQLEGSVVCSQICASKNDGDDLFTKLKITPCPHCKKTGFHIKHGSLLGYALNQLGYTVRAARAVRVYCSNRHRSNGCGRTFSVWTADKIKHLFLSAASLWQFLVVSDCPAKLTLEYLSKAFNEHKLSPIAAFAATLQTFFV